MTTSTVSSTVDPRTTPPPRSFLLALATVLGVGPFAIDMYLASLPEIGRDFAVPSWTVQLTLTGYLVMLGAGQLVAGPVTDAFGRRRPLLLGLGLFVAGCLLAAAAPHVAVLVLARMVQGAGAAIAFVVVNSAVRDRAEGEAATRAFAVLMTVSAVVPMISPTLGGWIGGHLGWRPVFVAMAGIGAFAFAVAFRWLPESLPVEGRTVLSFAPVMRAYGGHLRSGRILLPLGALAGAFVFLFCYLGGASYVYQGHYGLEQTEFGLVFGVTGVAALLGAVLAHRLAGKLSSARLGTLGVLTMALGGAVALTASLTSASLLLVALGMSLGLLGLGACEPAFMGLCMSSVSENLGAASALIGAAQYLLGALTTALIAFPAGVGAWAWATTMVVVALVSLALALAAARRAGAERV
ncbi:Bcr/CflA family efflux MFS transporter [Kocuria tytonis]|uniref:Bcr/CflA family efflux MFS transporter n=1 Tax=Kocuria tytonis TaxID=2054280 RepID=A0A495A666_9MICC|nr:Bcr/CflA family efflux MFS transporter [Kocuria tytonis]RKQ35015.1 Bcr/CflA family efflux MFS transporter [Kocuria tytonis]